MVQRVEEQTQRGEQQGLRILERRQRVKERVKDRLPKNVANMEARVAKMEGRIKRIEEHPDPTRPAVNKLLYKRQADSLRRLLEAWKTGNEPIGSSTLVGGFVPYPLTATADRTTPADAKRYFDIMMRLGLNTNACDRTTACIPMVMTGEYPAPDFITTVQGQCFPLYHAYQSLANLLGIPLLSHDCPPVLDEKALAYMTRQYEEEIDYLQTMFPGHKYDEAKLIEQQEATRIFWGYQRDIYQLRKQKPCPIAGIESFRVAGAPGAEDPWAGLEYTRLYRDQLYENAEKGLVPARIWGTEEKLRLLWAVSGLFYYDPFTFLDKLGVSVPLWHISNQAEKAAGRHPIPGDETPFGRKLKPLEEQARQGKGGWGELSDFYINSIIACSRDLDVDGIVFFKQTGCSPTMPLGGVVSQRAEHELGIPTLELEGRQMDQRGFNERDFLSKLVDFCNACLARKHLPSLTEKELEKAGYYQ